MTINHEVVSPCEGTLERVLYGENEFISEGEPLFVVRSDGQPMHVKAAYSGRVNGIEVRPGDEVIPGMILSYIQEEIS